MSQRNPMNPRSQARTKHGDGIKGASRKSAGSVKAARPAASSVYVSSKKSTSKTGAGSRISKGADDREAHRLERKRERAMASTVYDLPEYKRWRRVWWVCLATAIVAVGMSFLVNWLDGSGNLPEQLQSVKGVLASVFLAVGYAALIAGLVIDFTKMRKLRKAQEAKVHHMSKSELRELDAAIEAHDQVRAKAKPGTRRGRKNTGAGDAGEAESEG